MRKERLQETRYRLIPLAQSMPHREEGLTLLNPPLITRKGVYTFLWSIWRVLILRVRVLEVSATDKPASGQHWWVS